MFSNYWQKKRSSVGLSSEGDGRFRVLFEYSSDAHLILDENGIIDCNNAAIEILRCRDKAHLLSLTPDRISPEMQPDGRLSMEKSLEMNKIARHKGFHRFEWLHRRFDGEEFPVEVTLTPMALQNQVMMLAVWHDISEQKNYRLALEQLQLLTTSKDLSLDQKTDAMLKLGSSYLKTRSGIIGCIREDIYEILYLCPALQHIEKGRKFSIGDGFWLQTLKSDKPVAIHNVSENEKARYSALKALSIESYIGCPIYVDGNFFGAISFIDVMARPKPYGEYETNFMQLVAQWAGNEITRDRSARKLRESEERLFIAASGTSDGIWDWNPARAELYYSPRFKELLGYREDELQNLSREKFIELLHPDDRKKVMKALREHMEQRIPYHREVRLRMKGGGYKWFYSRGQAIWDENGRTVRMTGFVTDIDERKKMERMKNEFVSTVSHELRTPLTSIRGSLGLISGGVMGEVPNSAKNLIDIAYKNCERLVSLINDILDMEKIEAGNMHFDMKEIDLAPVLTQALEANHGLAAKYHIIFRLKNLLPAARVNADSNRLIQIITNLLSNAAKFSLKENSVDIIVEAANKGVRISVKDYGPGIPKEFIPRIFQKFAQADSSDTKAKGGTGLGLSIARAMTEKMGGVIDFRTDPGIGTVFYIELPLVHNIINIKEVK